MTPQELIEHLELVPHPEGGHYRRIYEGEAGAGRPQMTSIYYLLQAGEVSAWHRVDADELWHFYAGSPLALVSVHGNEPKRTRVLGVDVRRGERPQLLVPAHHWQTAQALGSFTLVGATVSPGFQFSGFELAGPDFEPP